MVENETFMFNKLVAGLDAKVTIWTDLDQDAVRVLQQQVNEFTDFDNQENVPNVDTLELTLFDVESKSSSQIWSKLRRNVRIHKFRLEMCGASQYKPNRSKSTSTYI